MANLLYRISKKLAPRPNGCIEFMGSRNQYGYGVIGEGKRKLWLAHRAYWTKINGPIPPKMVLRHSCDNPACCRLDHLIPGTQRDNLQDMSSRERGANILTAVQVIAIRQDKRIGKIIAAEYGVSKGTVNDARAGRTWVHLPLP